MAGIAAVAIIGMGDEGQCRDRALRIQIPTWNGILNRITTIQNASIMHIRSLHDRTMDILYIHMILGIISSQKFS